MFGLACADKREWTASIPVVPVSSLSRSSSQESLLLNSVSEGTGSILLCFAQGHESLEVFHECLVSPATPLVMVASGQPRSEAGYSEFDYEGERSSRPGSSSSHALEDEEASNMNRSVICTVWGAK